jgi:hypothetical protein
MNLRDWISWITGSEQTPAVEKAVEIIEESTEQPTAAVGGNQPKTLVVPHEILRRTHEYFLPYHQAQVETACFWFGVDAGQLQIVTTVGVPKLFQTAGNYRVERASMSRLSNAMRHRRLTNLAQIHTHPPNCGVEHSPYDDAHAYSTKNGALSLVWADYGSTLRPDLRSVGVHERRNGEWELLGESEVARRILLVDDFADFRWAIESGGISSYEE